ncbi:9711_t:CDS:2 [Diversispora eburnea]|uniref:9711_t:CDS:1 n=1 Tax=Diversispora eburnea TaxID=1213867 RepID=A0A9N9AT80_9GLOM|nr:9711_t:CDS:2 [Diversispora eburnea]
MPNNSLRYKVYKQKNLLDKNLNGKNAKDNFDNSDNLFTNDLKLKNQISSKISLCTLPTEILLRILYELIISESPNPPKTAILSFPLVCRVLYKLSSDRIIWEQVFLSEYDVSARKRRFSVCNSRKIYYRRSLLNVDQMNSSLDALENSLKNKLLPEKEEQKVIDNVLEVLTRLWVLVSEDGNLQQEEIVKNVAIKLRERVLNWDPNKHAVFPMFDCHALHIYLRYITKDEKKPLDPDSRLFDSRKSDEKLQWTDMVDVYSSNKILWCLRNDGYDFPYGPPRYWTGLYVDKCTYKDNLSYIIEGTLTDDSGKSFHIEGFSVPIDNGRRVSFRYVDNTKTIGTNNEYKVWNYYGYLTAYGIIGKCWPDGMIVENATTTKNYLFV